MQVRLAQFAVKLIERILLGHFMASQNQGRHARHRQVRLARKVADGHAISDAGLLGVEFLAHARHDLTVFFIRISAL